MWSALLTCLQPPPRGCQGPFRPPTHWPMACVHCVGGAKRPLKPQKLQRPCYQWPLAIPGCDLLATLTLFPSKTCASSFPSSLGPLDPWAWGGFWAPKVVGSWFIPAMATMDKAVALFAPLRPLRLGSAEDPETAPGTTPPGAVGEPTTPHRVLRGVLQPGDQAPARALAQITSGRAGYHLGLAMLCLSQWIKRRWPTTVAAPWIWAIPTTHTQVELLTDIAGWIGGYIQRQRPTTIAPFVLVSVCVCVLLVHWFPSHGVRARTCFVCMCECVRGLLRSGCSNLSAHVNDIWSRLTYSLACPDPCLC